jgi:hypothetical protein
MDIGRSFTFITEDEDWLQKVLIGGLISLIPIVGQFYMVGYAIQVIKATIEGREIPLPEVTQDFGDKLLKGLMASIIVFLYFLPVMIVGSVSGGGAAILSNALDDPDAAGAVAAIWSSCLGCVSLVLGILISLFVPFAWSRYAESGQFGDAFKFGEIWNQLKDNLGPALIAILLSAAVGIAAGIIGLILCLFGSIFTGFYAQLVTAFLYGSVYRQAKAKAETV